ncbi:hypothetical protein EDC19_2742 [Natranaerovirga hydrolytica]|uniref:Fibronectin type-III domain-containing protein n=1 Tax=Natranaerovirga hydrolytica TaxID=680378 RepID=A0A4R1M6M6_9FIRM|nr:hypothetical protein [Natranaerovirga hydrolytica]TCK87898.1 hypothetical protein EDC19_2742 [Natranaerovirga hydrolytica]
MRKRIILVLAFFIVSTFAMSIADVNISAADDLGFRWRRNDTIDDMLNVVTNVSGNEEVFLEWDFDQNGTYTLEYYLNDDIKNEVTFVHTPEGVTVNYDVLEHNGTDFESITEDEMNRSYLEMDYEALTPEWKSVNKDVENDGTIEFYIPRSTTTQYPGVAFRINNIDVKLRWNFQTGKFYFYTQGLQRGHITPFHLEAPSGNESEMNVLRSLEGFVVNPTHIVENGDNKTNVDLPGDEMPGGRPGLEIRFRQPKVYDHADQTFKTADELENVEAIIELNDIGSSAYTDFTINLSASNGSIINAPNSGLDTDVNNDAEFKYDDTNNEYIIQIVKDKADLQSPDDYIQWNRLESSSIYAVDLHLSNSDYEFASYSPVGGYGYTYLEYEVRRASMEDAYLEIKPYSSSDQVELEYVIYHSKSGLSGNENDNVWVRHYHDTSQSDANIHIPVPYLEGSNQEYYRVGVRFASRPISSQIIKYIPTQDDNVPPPTPRIKEIDNLVVVPSLDDDDPSAIQFDLIWESPLNTSANPLLDNMLDESINGKIYYELLVNKYPSGTEDDPYKVLKVFEAKKNDDGDIVLVEVDTGKEVGQPYDNNEFSKGYSSQNRSFAIRNIVLKDEDGWSEVRDIKEDIDEFNGEYLIEDGQAFGFEFPDVYFFRMRAVYISDDVSGLSDISVPASISLDSIRYSIPIPTGLAYDTSIFNRDVEISWNSIDIEDYEQYMVSPLNLTIDTVTYEWFLSSEEDKVLKEDNVIKFGDNNNESIGNNAIINLTEEQIEALRKGDVLSSEIHMPANIRDDLSFTVENLDSNHRYYFKVRPKLNIIDEELEEVETLNGSSSETLTIITPIEPEDPGDDLILPLAPEELEVSFIDETETVALVEWEYPRELNFEQGDQGFEIVVLRDRSLPDALRQKTLDLEDDIIPELEDLNELKSIFRVFVDEDGHYILEEYNLNNNRFEESDQEVEVDGNRIAITDPDLQANTVFYYHVRTTNLKGDTSLSSNWIMDTITTRPISPPINLIVPRPSPYNYDAKTETVIRFDVPIPYEDVNTDLYDIEVFVKGEEDSDYTDEYESTFIAKNEEAPDGYTRVFYRVSDLRSGRSYSIRVRIVDKTRELDDLPDEEEATYPRSGFSERVETRTDFDQSDYDRDEKFDQYIEYYLREVEKLKDQEYWILEEEDNNLSVKYRKEKIIGSNLSGQYNLLTKDKKSLDYYLPGEMIETFNTRNTNMLIKTLETELNIRANTIGERISKEITNIRDDINQYESEFKDYYVHIRIRKGEFNGRINNLVPISDLMDIQIRLIPSYLIEEEMETRILQELDRIASNHEVQLIDKLEKELESGINDERLNIIVNEVLENVKRDHQRRTHRIFERNTKEKNVNVSNINRPIQISWIIESSNQSISGFHRSSTGWNHLNVTQSLGRHFVNANQTGSYILVDSGIDLNNYTQQEAKIINTFNLNNVFSSDELRNPNRNATKQQIVESIAKIMGSGSGTNAVDYLNNMGIRVNRLDLNRPMSRAEAYDILLSAYEIKKNVNLNSVSINNFNKVNDIEAIDEALRRKILAGAHLNIIPLDRNNNLQPNEWMSIKDLINFLAQLQ